MEALSATLRGVATSSRLRIKRLSRRVKSLWRGHRTVPVLPATWDPGEAAQPVAPQRLCFPGNDVSTHDERLLSCLCRSELLESAAFRYWAGRLRENWRPHRKLWEFSYICQALYERGLLREGCHGLGFAVGQEPLPSLFAAMGCRVVASDLPSGDPRVKRWAATAQWTDSLQVLNERGLCAAESFRQRVHYRPVDMNHIPRDLRDFDFTWSSCSFEHCGSLQLGQRFLMNQMECLRPGGVAVHTTEFNLTSNHDTLSKGRTVIFRRCDIDEAVRELRAAGHHVEPLELTRGDQPLDRYVDEPPYCQDRHLRLHLGDWAATSIGLIITKRLS